MYPYTKVESKLMIPLLNKPVVVYLVEELVASGIKDIVVVSNHVSKIKQLFTRNKVLEKIFKRLKKDNLTEELRKLESLCNLNLIMEEKPMGWMYEVLKAREYLEGKPFIVCFSDVLYISKIPASKQLIKDYKKKGKNIRSTGRYLFKSNTFKIIEERKYEFGKDVADLEVFEKLRQKNDLTEFNIKGEMYNIGDPLSHAEAETAFAINDKKFGKEYKDFVKNLLKK